ncbi:MAG: hypothetical protein ACLUEQ_05620 [Cloacibacillus evryensis]
MKDAVKRPSAGDEVVTQHRGNRRRRAMLVKADIPDSCSMRDAPKLRCAGEPAIVGAARADQPPAGRQPPGQRLQRLRGRHRRTWPHSL